MVAFVLSTGCTGGKTGQLFSSVPLTHCILYTVANVTAFASVFVVTFF